MSAEEFKKAGSAAYTAGKFQEAVEAFSNAIQAETGTDKEAKQFLKLVYSNRSAAYSQLRDHSKALADANKIVENLDPEWGKGHMRRGDAYAGLGDWTRAYNAYQRAERLSPNETSYKAKTESALNRIRRESERSSASNSAGVGSASAGAVGGTLGHIKGLCSKGVWILALLYLLPLSWIPYIGSMAPDNVTSYRLMIVSSLVSNVIAAYSVFGLPQFSMDYVAKVMSSMQMGPVLLGLMLLAARPYWVGAAPLLLIELNNNMDYFASYLRGVIPQIKDSPQAAAYAPQIASLEQMLNSPSGVVHLRNEVNKMACTCEVLQGAFLVLELVMPARNFILTYMWWQYLMMRYLMDPSGHIKIAFGNLDGNIMSLISHQYCPSIVRKGYDMVKAFVVNQIKSKQDDARNRASGGGAAGGGDSWTSRIGKSCTIA